MDYLKLLTRLSKVIQRADAHNSGIMKIHIWYEPGLPTALLNLIFWDMLNLKDSIVESQLFSRLLELLICKTRRRERFYEFLKSFLEGTKFFHTVPETLYSKCNIPNHTLHSYFCRLRLFMQTISYKWLHIQGFSYPTQNGNLSFWTILYYVLFSKTRCKIVVLFE